MQLDDFIALLRAAYLEREQDLAEKWNRSLPFGDALFDRWERAKRLGFAPGASIYNSALVYGDVDVGSHTWVGPNVLLDGTGGGLEIGAYCSLAAGAQVYTHDTVYWALSGGKMTRRVAPVSIADCCYIGSLAIIGPGVTIGERSVVAAGSFVNRPVPASSIVGGTPARVIGHVVGTGEHVELVFDGSPAPPPE